MADKSFFNLDIVLDCFELCSKEDLKTMPNPDTYDSKCKK